MINLIQNKNGYYYLVYKITNKINGHFYIGVHATTEPFDNYMGSGYALRHAKKKYGIKNFTKELLFSFETEDEMYDKEREIVNSEFIKRKDVYNQSLGGRGAKHSKIKTELIEINGIFHTKKEWCQIYNKNFENTLHQMYDHNISFKEALFKERQRRAVVYIEFNGQNKRINEWVKITGIARTTIRKRYMENLPPQQIFKEFIDNNYVKYKCNFIKINITFNGETHNPTQWQTITGISRSAIQRRYLNGFNNTEIFKEYINNNYQKIKSKRILLTVDGISKPASYWSKISGINKRTILYRKRKGMDDYSAIFTPLEVHNKIR